MESLQTSSNSKSTQDLVKFETSNQTILEEVSITNDDITDHDILDYARLIGIVPDLESDLLWIAEAGLKHNLPLSWIPVEDHQGRIYYFNQETLESTWDHPLDRYYRLLVRSERIKILSKKVMSKLLANLHFLDDNGSFKENHEVVSDNNLTLSEKDVKSDEYDDESIDFELDENDMILEEEDDDDDDEIITIDVTEGGVNDTRQFKEIYTIPLNKKQDSQTGHSQIDYFKGQLKASNSEDDDDSNENDNHDDGDDIAIDDQQLRELSKDPFKNAFNTSQKDRSSIIFGNHSKRSILPTISEVTEAKDKPKIEQQKDKTKVLRDDEKSSDQLNERFKTFLSQIDTKIEKIRIELNDKIDLKINQIMSQQEMSQKRDEKSKVHQCLEKDRLNNLESNLKNLRTSLIKNEDEWKRDLNEIKNKIKNFDKETSTLTNGQDKSTLVKLSQELKILNDEMKKIKLKDLKVEQRMDEGKRDEQSLAQKLKRMDENISNIPMVIDKEINKVKQLIQENIRSIDEMYSKDISTIKKEQNLVKEKVKDLEDNAFSRSEWSKVKQTSSVNGTIVSKIISMEESMKNILNKLDKLQVSKSSPTVKLFKSRKVRNVQRLKENSESSLEENSSNSDVIKYYLNTNQNSDLKSNYSWFKQTPIDQVSMELENQKRYQDIRASSMSLLSLIKKTSNMLKEEVDHVDSIGNYKFTTNLNSSLLNCNQSDSDQVTIDQLEAIRNGIDVKLKKLTNVISRSKM